MRLPLVLFVHRPKIRPYERGPAIAARFLLADYPTEWATHSIGVVDEHSYAGALASVWDHDGDLINVEHDIAATPDHIRALLACPHPLCAWTYPIAPATSGRYHVIPSVTDPYYTYGVEFAHHPAPGLCKIGWSIRSTMGPPPLTLHYKEVEGWLWREALGLWHLHYPYIAHHHGFPEGYYARFAEQAVETPGRAAGAPGGA